MNESIITTKDQNNTKLLIQQAQKEDAQIIVNILSSALQYKVSHGDMVWGTEPYSSKKLLHNIKEGNTYIARIGNIPVGTLTLLLEDEMIWGKQPPIATYVHKLAIKDGYHGRDLGKKLLDWASQQATNNGRSLLRIDFHYNNYGLRSYYEKLGFKLVEKNRKIHIPHRTTIALYERSTTKVPQYTMNDVISHL
ncbi:GNAT family N-acetyltransferase [Patescibacteria group bacterium]|nr:GNAT family N-acetyltransferase [Patescibacteria group bacterium]